MRKIEIEEIDDWFVPVADGPYETEADELKAIVRGEKGMSVFGSPTPLTRHFLGVVQEAKNLGLAVEMRPNAIGVETSIFVTQKQEQWRVREYVKLWEERPAELSFGEGSLYVQSKLLGYSDRMFTEHLAEYRRLKPQGRGRVLHFALGVEGVAFLRSTGCRYLDEGTDLQAFVVPRSSVLRQDVVLNDIWLARASFDRSVLHSLMELDTPLLHDEIVVFAIKAAKVRAVNAAVLSRWIQLYDGSEWGPR